jgi:anti-sigma factor RsiW
MSEPSASQNDAQRFQQLLPFYVTRQLSASDKDFVDAYLADNPASQNALQFTEQLSQVVRRIGADRNPDLALQKLLNNLTPARQNILQRLVTQWRSAGRISRIFIILAAAALLRLASPDAWFEAVIGLLDELGIADAALLVM